MKKFLLLMLFVIFSGTSANANLLNTSVNWDRISWLEIFWNKHAILPACMVGAFIVNNLWWKRSYKSIQADNQKLKEENQTFQRRNMDFEALQKNIKQLRSNCDEQDQANQNLLQALKKQKIRITKKQIINEAEDELAELQNRYKQLNEEKKFWQLAAQSDFSYKKLKAIKQNVLQIQTRSELTTKQDQDEIHETLTNLGFVPRTLWSNWYKNDPTKNFPMGTNSAKDDSISLDAVMQEYNNTHEKLHDLKKLNTHVKKLGIEPRSGADLEVIKKLCNELGFEFKSELNGGLVFKPTAH